MDHLRIAIVALGLAPAPSPGTPHEAGASLPVVGEATPLRGWVEFCRRMPSECAVPAGGGMRIPLTAATKARLDKANRAVNDAIRPVTDMDHWGVADRWDIPTDGKGDCEDYVLRKRQVLVAAGMPRAALRVAVVINELNEGHAVLLALTSGGDLVLDNRTGDVVRWDRTGYTFVKRESDDGRGWSALRPSSVRPAEAASVR